MLVDVVLNNGASIHAQGAMCSFVLNVIEAKCEFKRFFPLAKGLLIGVYFHLLKIKKTVISHCTEKSFTQNSPE